MARKQTANTIIDTTKEAHMPKSNGLKVKIDDLRTFEPLTDNQKLFFDAYKRGDYFVALHGVAGTGKTFCALYKAIEEVLDKSNPFNKIIVVRSAVQGREILAVEPYGLRDFKLRFAQEHASQCEWRAVLYNVLSVTTDIA